MLSAAWGQTNNCPILGLSKLHSRHFNTTAQIKDMLSRHTQQQSASESLTNLMQLTLARQLMADLDIKPATIPCSPANGCDCNETATALKQLQTESIDNRNAIRKLAADNKKQKAQSVEAIRNLTADNERLTAQLMDNEEAISNLTADNERLEAQSVENEEAISNLTTVVDMLVQSLNLTETEYLLCGSSGWTRVAYLNMTDPSEQCPSGFRLYNETSVRACGRPSAAGNGDHSSVQFPTGINYSEVCGRVTGYQYYDPEAFHTSFSGIDRYVDGVSLTHGSSPRKHIWTFAASGGGIPFCPCSTGSIYSAPALVGNDYFCESGNPGNGHPTLQLYPEPLWDGKGCSSQESACCQAAGIPWFHKRLNASTNDYIELRICSDASASSNEDIPVGYYEIYVK